MLTAVSTCDSHGKAEKGRLVEIPDTGDRKADVLEATRRYHALFEQWIRENPSQWMWIMRKWV